MASKRLDPNASLADYKENTARKQPMGNTKPKEHLAQKRTKIDKAIANAQAFQKQRTALINMSTKDKLGAALEAGIIGAATGGGVIAAQKGIRAAVNTGIPARIGNKVTGKTVVVHGSPVSGIKEIKPNLSTSAKMLGYNSPEAYAANPSTGNSLRMAQEYAALSGSNVSSSTGGSVYIAKAKSSSLSWREGVKKSESPMFSSEKPFKVTKEFPVSKLPEPKVFNKELKRAGVKLPRNK